MVLLRVFVQKLTSLSPHSRSRHNINVHDLYYQEEELEVPTLVPNDVKEGHFAVIALKGSERKRFVLKLEWLNNPEFLRLLQLAEEEYGFEQTGVIVVPCRPQELEKILMASQ